MRHALFLSTLLVIGGQSAVIAKPLVCPSSTPATAVVQKGELAPLVGVDNPVDRAAMLGRIVATMRDRGVTPSAIIDSLVSSYCPMLAADTALSDDQKAANIRSFAAQAARAAYAFENAEEIILDVAIPPSIANTVNSKAKMDRVTPEAWAATAVINAAKASK